MDVVIMIAQLLLALSILVGVHEWGHMATAKYFGMRVEKFSIGFPPKVFGVQWGETEYSFGAIPLGGFVKISGMIDESMDKEQMKRPAQPWEFRSKPAWQRLVVMLGGVTVNVIVGIVIFIGLKFFLGEQYTPIESVHKHGMVVHELAKEIGFQENDKILSINGEPIADFESVTSQEVILGDDAYITVERDGQKVDISIPNDFLQRIQDADRKFLTPKQPFKISYVSPEQVTGAYEAGIVEGDSILRVNGQAISYYHELKELLDANKNSVVQVEVWRDGTTLRREVELNEDGQMGIGVEFTEERHRDFGLGESVVKGTYDALMIVPGQIAAFKKFFTEKNVKASENVSSIVGIAKIYGGQVIWAKFWLITGTLSVILAFVNLLPIPALDGGHVVFLLYEMVSGREPSEKFMENAQKFGMLFLLALMALVLGNDIYQNLIK